MWNETSIRNVPIFLAVGPGSDPKALATERVIGNTTPPPRAVSDGMKGASTRSAAASEYPRRNGVRPKRSMNRYPTRVPKPGLRHRARKQKRREHQPHRDVAEARPAPWPA